MVRMKLFVPILGLLFAIQACQEKREIWEIERADVKIVTDTGDIYIDLFDDTPNHRDNFLKLAREGFYDGVTFHRVISEFMIQSGDPRTKPGATTTADDAGYNLPHEIRDNKIHTRRMVAAARYGDAQNPKWESSSSQFYIVTGQTVTPDMLDMSEQVYNQTRQSLMYADYLKLFNSGEFKDDFNNYLAEKEFVYFGYSDEFRKRYSETKGSPQLDFMYTIFGEVVGGMETVTAIEFSPTGPGDVPKKSIRIQKIEILN